MSAVQQSPWLRRSNSGAARLLILSLTALLWLICTQHNLCSFHFSTSTPAPNSAHCSASVDEDVRPSTHPVKECHETPCLAVLTAGDQVFESLNLSGPPHALINLDVLPWLLGWLLGHAVSLPRVPPPYRRSPRQIILYGYCVLRN